MLLAILVAAFCSGELSSSASPIVGPFSWELLVVVAAAWVAKGEKEQAERAGRQTEQTKREADTGADTDTDTHRQPLHRRLTTFQQRTEPPSPMPFRL
jgi:hypothetical protein